MAVQRHGRAVLLAAALTASLVGAAACGSRSADTVTAEPSASPTATESAVLAPAESPSADASATATATAPITVTSPADGATVKRSFTVTGTSRTPEGTVIWALERNGEVVANDVADGGSEKTAPFRFTVTAPAAGTYTLRVFQESAKDGKAASEIRRTLTVR